jgi:hypothetical protein
LHGKDSWGWRERSAALHLLQMTKEAFDTLKPAASLFPNDLRIVFSLACYSARMGNTNEAKFWLKCVFNLAEKEGPHSSVFASWRKMALENSDLISVQSAIPQPPVSWKFRKYFGV